MIPTFLKLPFLDMASSIWAMPKEQWIDDSVTKDDIDILLNESKEDSLIDKINFRNEMIQSWKRKEVDIRVRELPGRTRLVFLGTQRQFQDIPWDIWARIFQAIDHPIGRIVFYAHPSKRSFNNDSSPLGPENINGGYTNICSQERIVIYRFEEATRVLLHELLHTACFDTEKPVEYLEAHTEAWAEIFLCALLSKGKPNVFRNLWAKQCRWIEAQCNRLQVSDPKEYSWRYITGKRDVLYGLGVLKSCPGVPSVPLTPRFTTPEWKIV